MRTLCIDIGGTKFTVAVFEDDRMVVRESRSTDREGGRDWMLSQIESIVEGQRFDRCGIGFGGPVDFASSARRTLDACRRLERFRSARLYLFETWRSRNHGQ